MNSVNSICIILGSGFSKPAGLPLAKEIDAFFTRNNVETLLKFSSGEWKWWDFANDAYRNNGRLNSDYIPYGYILNELVSAFIKANKEFISYETFYQFVIDGIKSKDFVQAIYQKAFDKSKEEDVIDKDERFYEDNTYAFRYPDASEIYNMINYLIDDLLYWRKSFDEFESFYFPFLSYIIPFTEVNVITLNHDFLLEALFENNGIEYTDGFSNEKSPLQSEDKINIKYFCGKFDSKFSIIKLHGSIDVYKYIVSQQEGSMLYPTGEYIYFKTHDYYEKQKPVRVNPETGEIVQDFHWNITPQFITGTRKEELIANDKMYACLYSEFEKRIHSSETLLIIGYSFGDEHVNNQIRSALTYENLKKVINVNPFDKFPYNSDRISILNINTLEEISCENY